MPAACVLDTQELFGPTARLHEADLSWASLPVLPQPARLANAFSFVDSSAAGSVELPLQPWVFRPKARHQEMSAESFLGMAAPSRGSSGSKVSAHGHNSAEFSSFFFFSKKKAEIMQNRESDQDCEIWAAAGDCDSNKSFMRKKCQLSCCRLRPEFQDEDPRCALLAANGECSTALYTNSYMDRKCTRSCDVCSRMKYRKPKRWGEMGKDIEGLKKG
eukprot:gnl/TRDRNA2_/TRDRNA2_203683_c0_seq1.p1 gnl/TRDRNA2_/TRDRNA2_203683_c0~~gnl/TRDRNA2_/TRDRNA2_203683_c0_seq1.p1  ORF type:complete len:217 (+),score=31.39 gnl/TRDRNA2_/TRDRNA2_203683_c0_seq1:128-778(+)